LRISHRWEIFYATKPTLQRSPLQQVFKLPISPVNKNSSLTSVGKSIPLSALFCSFPASQSHITERCARTLTNKKQKGRTRRAQKKDKRESIVTWLPKKERKKKKEMKERLHVKVSIV